jgi:hypothetical protein
VIIAAGVNADWQSQPLRGYIYWPVGAFTERHVAHDQHQHLNEALIRSASLDFRDRFLHALHRYHDRTAQPAIPVQPFFCQPIVQCTAERIRHVLGENHLDPEQRIADGVVDAERVERLRLHVGQA